MAMKLRIASAVTMLVLALPQSITTVSVAQTHAARSAAREKPLYTYTLAQDQTPATYDESLAVACLQGIINRGSPDLYVLSRKNNRPAFWLDVLSKEDRWLTDRERRPLTTLAGLVKLAGPRVR